MKNLSLKIRKNVNLFKKDFKIMASEWLKSLRKDIKFCNEYTELLAIWTVLFITITGLFILAIKSNFLIMLLLFVLAVTVTFIVSFASIKYLYVLKYQKRKSVFTKIHNLLNKSFRLRDLFRFIKLPRISIPNIVKTFKLAS